MPKSPDVPLNRFQKKLCEVYGNGDFSHLAEKSYREAQEYAGGGDTLFLFMLRELSDQEDCTDLQTAIWRMENAKDDVQRVFVALENMWEEEDHA